ncbi:hypothetical protein AB4238_01560 [Shewanella sp. 10N.286.45.A1]|uniref:hypothetical protein n=1 Tax=Shewanella sp. 10N.286.45.A1 TaxID=3229694 RepID=UPI00355342D5
MADETIVKLQTHVQGREFDEPFYMSGGIDIEPERYIAEKPYDLTKYEFKVLKKSSSSIIWFNLCAGGTAGIVIAVIGKTLASLIEKTTPSVSVWEIIAIIAGVGISLLIKKYYKSEDEKEKEQLLEIVESHFVQNPMRRVHLTSGENNNEI